MLRLQLKSESIMFSWEESLKKSLEVLVLSFVFFAEILLFVEFHIKIKLDSIYYKTFILTASPEPTDIQYSYTVHLLKYMGYQILLCSQGPL